MNFMNKFTIVATVSVAALLLATGCSSSAGDAGSSVESTGESSAATTPGVADGSKVVITNLYSQGLPYFQDVAKGVNEAAAAAGWESEIVFGQTDPALQFTQIQNGISKKPGGMIIAPIDQESLLPVFAEAAAAGVQMVTVADDVAEAGWPNELAYVGVEYQAIGAMKAQKIADAIGGKGKVGVVHGIRGLHFSEAQWEGAQEIFAKYPDITLIDVGYAGGFSSDLGLEKAENILTSNPDTAAIFFDNDDLALGGILAAKARKIPMDKIFIVGADGGKPAQDAVKAGDLDYSISFCGYITGVQAFEVLRAKVEMGESPATHIVPVEVIEFTPENVQTLIDKVAAKTC